MRWWTGRLNQASNVARLATALICHCWECWPDEPLHPYYTLSLLWLLIWAV